MCYCILNISSWDDLLITLTSVIVFFNIPGTAGNKVASSASRGLCLGIRAGWLIVLVHWLRRRWSYHPHPHHPSHHHTRCSSQTKAALYAQRSVAAMRLMALSHCSCPDCRAPAGAPAGKKKPVLHGAWQLVNMQPTYYYYPMRAIVSVRNCAFGSFFGTSQTKYSLF